MAIIKFNGWMDITAWIAAGAAAGTFALEPLLGVVRTGRRARAYARFGQLLDLREKSERLGASSPHLVAAIDESIKVVRGRIAMSELSFAIRRSRKSRRDRLTPWLLATMSLIPLILLAFAPLVSHAQMYGLLHWSFVTVYIVLLLSTLTVWQKPSAA